MKKALLLPVLLLAACQGEAPSGRPPPPPPAAGVSAALAVLDGDGAAGPFRLSELTRLALEARCVGVEAGAHAARIDVLTPRGTLYAQFQGTLEVGSGSASAATFTRTLEVSGTPIDAFHQVGTWRFVLTVDEGAPLATAEASLVE
jgi:hypothetical protein